MSVAVAIGIAMPGMVVAVRAARDGVAGETASHAADHRTHNAVRSQAADQGAAASAQYRSGVVRMAAAGIRKCAGRSGHQRESGYGCDPDKVFHAILLVKIGQFQKEKTGP